MPDWRQPPLISAFWQAVGQLCDLQICSGFIQGQKTNGTKNRISYWRTSFGVTGIDCDFGAAAFGFLQNDRILPLNNFKKHILIKMIHVVLEKALENHQILNAAAWRRPPMKTILSIFFGLVFEISIKVHMTAFYSNQECR